MRVVVGALAGWLRDEEAAGSNPATPTHVTGHSPRRDVAFSRSYSEVQQRLRAGLPPGPAWPTPGTGRASPAVHGFTFRVRGLETWARLARFFGTRSSVTALVSALRKIVQASRMVRYEASRRQH